MKFSMCSGSALLHVARKAKPLGHIRLVAFAVIACALTISHTGSLHSQESFLNLRHDAGWPIGKDSSKLWAVQGMPFPRVIVQTGKQEPEVDREVLRRYKHRGHGSSRARGPGCASSDVIPSAGNTVDKARSSYAEGMKRYVSGDFVGAIESFDMVMRSNTVPGLSGWVAYFIGESLYHLGKPDRALRQFQEFVHAYPDHELATWAYYSMGWIYLKQEDWEKALDSFGSMAENADQDRLAPMVLIWEGEALGRSGQTMEAIAAKRSFLREHAEHPMAPAVELSVGPYLFQLHRFGEAAEAFRNFLERQPSHPLSEEARYGLGLSLIYDGNPDQGLLILENNLSPSTDDPLMGLKLFGVVRGYLAKGEIEIALEEYEDLIGRFPGLEWGSAALFDIGYFYLQEEAYRKSVEVYQTLLQTYPENTMRTFAYVNLGDAFCQLGRYGEALDSFRLAKGTVQEESLRAEILFKEGLCLHYQQDYGQAIETWERLLKDDTRVVGRKEVLYWMGKAFLYSLNPKKAMMLFDGLEADEEIYPKVLNSLGLYYFEREEWNQAIRYLLTLLDRYPDHRLASNGRLLLAHAFYRRRDYAEALSHLDELLRVEEAANLDRAYLLQGRIHYRKKEWDLAIDRLRRLLILFPESRLVDESQYWIGWSYYRKAMYGLAIEAFAKVVEDSPSRRRASHALLKIGDSYYHLRSYGEAADVYRRLVRKFPSSEKVPEAEYGILLTLEQQGMFDGFVERAYAFLATYAGHPRGADVLWKLGQHYEATDRIDRAIASYRDLLREYSRSTLADDAQFKIGEIYRGKQNFETAILEFGLVIKKYPTSALLPNAYFEIAESYLSLEDFRRALEGYTRVARGFPESDMAGTAYLKAADCFNKLGRRDLAERILAEVMERYPDDSIRFRGALRLGLILSEDLRYAEAIDALREAAKAEDPEVAGPARAKLREIARKWEDDGSASNL